MHKVKMYKIHLHSLPPVSVKREILETLILVYPWFCLIPIGFFVCLFVYVYGYVGSGASVCVNVCGKARVRLRDDGPIGIRVCVSTWTSPVLLD